MSDIHSPPNTMPHIGKIWAYLSKDEYGNEGVCAMACGPFGASMVPLIAADQARLSVMTPIAERLARESGKTIVLVEFTTRVDVRQISGASS